MESANEPLGARGPSSGREFDPDLSGGPIRRLSTRRVKVTARGIDVVSRHLDRFGPDTLNQRMIHRLRDIALGCLTPTPYDLNFYTHELREFVRYRRLGWPAAQPSDPDQAYEFWNHVHTASLEDYQLPEGNLYHPGVRP